jgi:GT2 family glycosyltransferase
MISLVIPTYRRAGVLRKNLRELARQTLIRSEWEVIIVNDSHEPIDLPDEVNKYNFTYLEQDNAGPAAARNCGASVAKGSQICFIGDDTFCHANFLFYHWLSARNADGPIAIQGYTDWWPGLPPLEFEHFLVESGLQANWTGLKNSDGSWKREANGFCMTTNYSIHREEYERLYAEAASESERMGGFHESFPHAAWEDIDFGFRGQKHGLKTIFEPNAVNFHAHRQTFDGFVKRQITEGKSRLHLCALHPELAGQLLDPESLRNATKDGLQRLIAQARELENITPGDKELDQLRKQKWHNALRVASLEGIRQGIETRSQTQKVWGAIPHVHSPEQAMHVVATAVSLEKGEMGFAMTSAEWGLRSNVTNWALWAVKGEVELAMGRKAEAYATFKQAVSLGPGATWPLERMKELSQ